MVCDCDNLEKKLKKHLQISLQSQVNDHSQMKISTDTEIRLGYLPLDSFFLTTRLTGFDLTLETGFFFDLDVRRVLQQDCIWMCYGCSSRSSTSSPLSKSCRLLFRIHLWTRCFFWYSLDLLFLLSTSAGMWHSYVFLLSQLCAQVAHLPREADDRSAKSYEIA